MDEALAEAGVDAKVQAIFAAAIGVAARGHLCADILSYILSGAPYYVTVWRNKDTTLSRCLYPDHTGVRLLIVIHNRS